MFFCSSHFKYEKFKDFPNNNLSEWKKFSLFNFTPHHHPLDGWEPLSRPTQSGAFYYRHWTLDTRSPLNPRPQKCMWHGWNLYELWRRLISCESHPHSHPHWRQFLEVSRVSLSRVRWEEWHRKESIYECVNKLMCAQLYWIVGLLPQSWYSISCGQKSG